MLFPRRRVLTRAVLLLLTTGAGVNLTGCASPGSPRPPSLQLPQPVHDLSAQRMGDSVDLRFTVPVRTTDGQPLRRLPVTGSLCRQVGSGPCTTVALPGAGAGLPRGAQGKEAVVLWTDKLPADLLAGPLRPVAYRVEVRNSVGRTAGWSNPAYAASGKAPPAVSGLSAQGTRAGILLRWIPIEDAGEVLLERVQVSEAPRADGRRATRPESELQADPGNGTASQTMDHNADDGVAYRYVALRRVTVKAGGHLLEVRSAPSPPVAFTWTDVYPPDKPQGLTALAFTMPASPDKEARYAVDLVWQPVNDTREVSYLVYRQSLGAAGELQGEKARLTGTPVHVPGFHDGSAVAGGRYRYLVTAVYGKGQESGAAVAEVGP